MEVANVSNRLRPTRMDRRRPGDAPARGAALRAEIYAWHPPVSPFVAGLRAKVGHGLLLLPAVTVLVIDPAGRVLLLRELDADRWTTISGPVEVDEDPADAARREAEEAAGVVVELGDILGVLGGPAFRVSDANGDETAYVTTVYAASVRWGTPHPDAATTSDVRWFDPAEVNHLELHPVARATFAALGVVTPA